MPTSKKGLKLNIKDNVQEIPPVAPSQLAVESPNVVFSPLLGETRQDWTTEPDSAAIEREIERDIEPVRVVVPSYIEEEEEDSEETIRYYVSNWLTRVLEAEGSTTPAIPHSFDDAISTFNPATTSTQVIQQLTEGNLLCDSKEMMRCSVSNSLTRVPEAEGSTTPANPHSLDEASSTFNPAVSSTPVRQQLTEVTKVWILNQFNMRLE